MGRKQLIKGLERVSDNKPILFCFPYAGGGASAYKNWPELIGNDVSVCSIQLPGREDRIAENPYTSMEKLLDDIVSRICYYSQNPIYLFGHSMGAKIASETARILEGRGIRVSGLIVSASKTIDCPIEKPLSKLPKEEFVNELVKFNGIPEELLNNQAALDYFIPMLRADFIMDESYGERSEYKLKCPIVAICGSVDKEAQFGNILEWKKYTDKGFYSRVYPGDHFYIKNYEKDVVRNIRRLIKGDSV